jgi:transcriptional regulator with XRE-family HTH domain
MIDREKVGRAIAAQRREKGLTQKQLAQALNVSYQAVSRWEQGISLPSVDIIYDIATMLETTVDFLLNGFAGERRVISYMDSGRQKASYDEGEIDRPCDHGRHAASCKGIRPGLFQAGFSGNG